MIRVGESQGKGRGVFAARAIGAGETIEDGPVVVVPAHQITQLDATVLGDYYFLWSDDESEAALLLGLGSLCNHSYEPNARFELHPERLTISFIALRDIRDGEEVTINYNGNPGSRKPLWFPTRE